MTIEKSSWDQKRSRASYDSMYEVFQKSATEIVLQPCSSLPKVMRKAWLGLVALEVLILPLTILPTFLVIFFILMTLSAIAPTFLNSWITKVIVTLIWIMCARGIAFLTGKVFWESGYTTFVFDRIEKQLLINTVNLMGKKHIKKIAFTQIQDVKFHEYESDGISIEIRLILEKVKSWSFRNQETINLSSFSSEDYQFLLFLDRLSVT